MASTEVCQAEIAQFCLRRPFSRLCQSSERPATGRMKPRDGAVAFVPFTRFRPRAAMDGADDADSPCSYLLGCNYTQSDRTAPLTMRRQSCVPVEFASPTTCFMHGQAYLAGGTKA